MWKEILTKNLLDLLVKRTKNYASDMYYLIEHIIKGDYDYYDTLYVMYREHGVEWSTDKNDQVFKYYLDQGKDTNVLYTIDLYGLRNDYINFSNYSDGLKYFTKM